MVDEALALYRKASELAPGNPQYQRISRRIPAPAQAARRGHGRLGARSPTGPTATPRTWAGWPRCWPASATSRRRSAPLDRGRRARQGRLRPADEAGRATCTGWSRSTTPRPSSPRPPSWPSRTRRRAAVLEARVKNDQAAGRLAAADRGAAARSWRRARMRRPSRWIAAGPLPRGRRQAARGGPRGRPRDRRSSPDRSRPGRWRPASASRPGNLGDAADCPPPAGRDRPPQPDRVPHRDRPARVAAGPRRRRHQGRPRPAGRRAGQPRALRVLRPALLPARAGPRRGSTPSAAPCASTPTTPRSS